MARSRAASLSTAPPRRGESSKAQGDETRLRIIIAAVEVFATLGYEGAGTRELAARGDVNLASLTYYFGGKPALYSAAIDYVVARIDDIVRPSAQHVAETLASGTWTGDCEAPLLHMLFNVLDQWINLNLGRTGQHWDKNWRYLLARAEVEPPIGDPWIYRTTTELILAPISAIICHLHRLEPDDEQGIMLAMSILGQIQFFKPHRDGQVLAANWASITDDRYQSIRFMIHANTRKMLVR